MEMVALCGLIFRITNHQYYTAMVNMSEYIKYNERSSIFFDSQKTLNLTKISGMCDKRLLARGFAAIYCQSKYWFLIPAREHARGISKCGG